jgi:hypothetical protein
MRIPSLQCAKALSDRHMLEDPTASIGSLVAVKLVHVVRARFHLGHF